MTCLIKVKQTLLVPPPAVHFSYCRRCHSGQDFLNITAVTAGASKKQPSKLPIHLRWVDEEE